MSSQKYKLKKVVFVVQIVQTKPSKHKMKYFDTCIYKLSGMHVLFFSNVLAVFVGQGLRTGIGEVRLYHKQAR